MTFVCAIVLPRGCNFYFLKTGLKQWPLKHPQQYHTVSAAVSHSLYQQQCHTVCISSHVTQSVSAAVSHSLYQQQCHTVCISSSVTQSVSAAVSHSLYRAVSHSLYQQQCQSSAHGMCTITNRLPFLADQTSRRLNATKPEHLVSCTFIAQK
jgi:hypothetical protein